MKWINRWYQIGWKVLWKLDNFFVALHQKLVIARNKPIVPSFYHIFNNPNSKTAEFNLNSRCEMNGPDILYSIVDQIAQGNTKNYLPQEPQDL